jgi:mono/diheme cytochrome c family protein
VTVRAALLAALIFGALACDKNTGPPEKRQPAPERPAEPPEITEVRQRGAELFFGRAGCAACHAVGARGDQIRCPNLGVAGEWDQPVSLRAASRRPELTAIEYVVESIVDPDVYVVPKYVTGVMKAPDEPPIALTDDEIVAVAAYLAGEGAAAPLKPGDLAQARARIAQARAVRDERRRQSRTDVTLAAIDWTKADAARGKAVFDRLGCASCHGNPKAKPDARGLLPPDLRGVGARLGVKEIARWVIDPPQNRMPNFASSVAGQELADLAAHVASR